MKTILFLLCAAAGFFFSAYQKKQTAPARDVEALTKPLLKPSILIAKTGKTTRSYFGGLPPSWHGFVWPEKDGLPLAFLACIDCAELPRVPELDWLPATGRLLFFYDTENQPWGFDPKDRGGWKVVYVGPEAALSETAAALSETAAAPAKAPHPPIPKKAVSFRVAALPPALGDTSLDALELSDAEADALAEHRQTLFQNQPHHQIGGYPDPVQDPAMDEESQLASNGIYCGNAEGYKDPRVEKLKPGASEWSLLFQMDTDEDLNLMWGDAGMLYFWIKRDDARAKKFENAWLILQCG